MKQIVLKAGRERSVLRGHPWIFSGAIESTGDAYPPKNSDSRAAEGQTSSPLSGEAVEVVSAKGERLGVGWYSPDSQIRVRMVPETSVADLVGSAVGRRADFFAHGYTNAVRLVNAESDRLPGVVADYYAGHVVIQLTSAGADARRDEIADALMTYAPFCLGVSERLDLKDREKEGLPTWRGQEAAAPVDDAGSAGGEGTTGDAASSPLRVLRGVEPPAEIEITEGPCKFLVDVRKGHKTGFYLDQRDARMLVGSLANGCEVLNCFSYTGGFGLFARACGAVKVTQVDVSGEALAMAKKNEQLVHMCGTAMEYVEADVFEYLRKCRDEGKSFDMIVLDPPKFAATKSQVMKAARGYKDINLLAMKLLKPNGYLATFSCSGAMTPELFDQVLAEAAVDAKKDFQVIARTRQGLDHPVALSFSEGFYLKGVVLRSM